jgi:hypothetical protein
MAVGGYDTIDNAQLTLAEQWDGSTWRIRRTPSPGDAFTGLSGVSCRGASDCMAVGSYVNGSDRTATLAERWDGRTWRVLPTPDPGPRLSSLTAVSCTGASDCMAVGYFDQAGTRQALAERWDGSHWQALSVPHGGVLTGVSCPSAGSCLAVGSYLGPGRRFALTVTWDGAAWTVRPSPSPGGTRTEFTATWCGSATGCFAVGDYNVRVASPLLPLSARWDGTAWHLLATPVPATGAGGLNAVTCSGPSRCVAVGSRFPRHGHDFPAGLLAETWNGSSWHVSATPAISAALRAHLAAVRCPGPTTCLATGGRLTTSGRLVALALAWNGTAWRTLPIRSQSPVSTDLYALSCPKVTRCVAAGETGPQRTLAYGWNGARWSVLATRNP